MLNHALLVPVGVEALVVNQTDKHSTIWSLGHKQYSGIDKFEPLEPPPFIRGNDWPRVGVTLHWALPDALTRGWQAEKKGLDFPFIPNRWLVVRTIVSEKATQPGAPGRRLKAWLVESDYLGPDGSNLYPDPETKGRTVTKIGRSWELGSWLERQEQGTGGLKPPHLTAIGPGDTTFTAYLANIDNVLTFYDALNELVDIEQPATLSYLVVGWHAQPGPNHLPVDWEDKPTDWKDPDRLAAWRWHTPVDTSDGHTQHPVDLWMALMQRYRWSLRSEQDLRHAIDDAWVEPQANLLDNYPARTVYHGQVFGVNWSGMHGPVQTGPLSRQNLADFRDPEKRADRKKDPQIKPERTETPNVAFGNSAIDALASLMEYFLERENGTVDISTLIQALEYGLVQTYDSSGGHEELDQRIHAEWFAGLPGGTHWELTVAPKESAPGPKDLQEDGSATPTTLREIENDLVSRLKAAQASDSDPNSERITDLQAALEILQYLNPELNNLNQQQASLDQDQRQVRSRQEALYALWWKKVRLPYLKEKPKGVNETELDNKLKELKIKINDILRPQLSASEKMVATLRQKIDDEIRISDEEIFLRLEKVGINLLLRQEGAPRFYQPSDPVALIYGMRRGARHGEDGRFAADGSLFVRFSRATEHAPGQTVQSLGNLDATRLLDSLTLASPQTMNGIATGIGGKWIPPEVRDLMVEATLLDAAQAKSLAWSINDDEKNVLRRQQMIWGDYRQYGVTTTHLALAAGLVGVRPSPVAVEKWSPPWSPLFFCWRVTFYPSDPDPAKALDDWRFDGLDFDWTGREPVKYEQAFTLQGRSLLIRTSTDALAQHLEGLFKQLHGETLPAEAAEALERVKSKLRTADLMSHPLTGFNDQLIMQDPQQFYNPDDPQIWGLIGDVRRAAPIPYQNGKGDSHFYPVRAGHFRLQHLWVVDAFGQVFDPIYEQGVTPASFTPIRGSGLVTSGLKQRTDTQMLQLPPRLIQASRLLFRFIPAGDPAVAARANGSRITLPEIVVNEDVSPPSAQDDNPICGWLVPNHFDKSLAVYDPDGRALGTLLLAGSAGEAHLTWQPAVNSKTSAETPLNLGNVHLQGFVDSLLKHAESGLVFTGLLATIDSTLWTTDPLGQRQDNLSTLIGRPLALVRARLELELAQDPVSDQSWEKTLTPDSKGFEEVRFPVELGHLNLRDDGTLGYFIEAERGTASPSSRAIDYSRFYTLHDTSGVVATGYFADRRLAPPLSVRPSSLSKPRDQHVTLILDPRGSIHVRSGILPTKAIQLPSEFIEPALANMDVTFRVGPVINEPHGMRMPLPAEIRGGWSWIAHTGVEMWSEEPITPADQAASLSQEALSLREGWLKLSDALGQKSSPEESNEEEKP